MGDSSVIVLLDISMPRYCAPGGESAAEDRDGRRLEWTVLIRKMCVYRR
jgi:hypothetical protein